MPADDWEKICFPQNVFFSKEFVTKKQKYGFANVYSLVAKDAGVKFLPESIIPRIKDGVVIDGGSYNAETAVALANYTDKKVYTFDFVTKHIEFMKNTIKSCHLEDQIEIAEFGISDVETSFAVQNDINSQGATLSTARESNDAESGYYLAKTISLDDFVALKKIEKISLIKLDIEGFEQKAIRGMQKLLQKDKPILLLSIYHHVDDFISIKKMIEDMNLGYKFKIRQIDPLLYYNIYQKPSEKGLHTCEYMLFAYVD